MTTIQKIATCLKCRQPGDPGRTLKAAAGGWVCKQRLLCEARAAARGGKR